MIVRIVKMTLIPEKLSEFRERYNTVESAIRNFDGCRHAELLTSVEHDGVVFTYSLWDSASHLELYRKSELFRTTWAGVKPLFASKAQAWTLERQSSEK